MGLFDFASSFEDIFPGGVQSFPGPGNVPDTGGFNWGNLLSGVEKVGSAFAPVAQIGALAFNAYNQLAAQNQKSAYDKAMQDYWNQRSAWESQYNQAMMDYLARRSEYEANVLGMMGESMGSFQEGLGNFQQQISDILGEQMGAFKPILAQSRELLEPAVAALARGEVPPEWEPLLAQIKQRTSNAMLQTYANAGIDVGTAAASIQSQVDQQAHAMLIQLATAQLGQGESLAKTGFGGAAQAAQTAGLGLDPLVAEQKMMMDALSRLFGGFPSLAGGGPPPAPTA